MTYSQQIKTELCQAKLLCKECKKSLLYGMLLSSKGVSLDSVEMNTESKYVADLFIESMIDTTKAIVTLKSPNIRERTKRPIYTIYLENQEDIKQINSMFFKHNLNSSIDYRFLNKECCQIAFLRAVYLVCGSMINPQKEYHLEFYIANKALCDELYLLLQESGLDFKKTMRNKNYVLYIKESQQIEDTLTYLGAIKASMELMNLKIEKELRNKANRQANCEVANIDKTINASLSQIKKIQYIKDEMGFDFLTPELREAAVLRLEHADLSLSQLCALSKTNISRSGLNHRLRKLCKIADEIKREEKPSTN